MTLTPSPFLAHAVEECVGWWVGEGPIHRPGAYRWRCTHCGATHPSTPENDRAALLEFVHGVRLGLEGRPRQPPPPFPRECAYWLPLPVAPDQEDVGTLRSPREVD